MSNRRTRANRELSRKSGLVMLNEESAASSPSEREEKGAPAPAVVPAAGAASDEALAGRIASATTDRAGARVEAEAPDLPVLHARAEGTTGAPGQPSAFESMETPTAPDMDQVCGASGVFESPPQASQATKDDAPAAVEAAFLGLDGDDGGVLQPRATPAWQPVVAVLPAAAPDNGAGYGRPNASASGSAAAPEGTGFARIELDVLTLWRIRPVPLLPPLAALSLLARAHR